MICPRCYVKNPDSSDFCSACGTSLPKRRIAAKNKPPVLIILLATLALCVCAYVVVTSLKKTARAPQMIELETAGHPEAEARPSREGLPPFAAGLIRVRGSLDAIVSESASAVCSGRWVALPTWALVGGESADFIGLGSSAERLENGYWNPGEPVALWQIDGQKQRETLTLSPWQEGVALRWHSLQPATSVFTVEIVSPQKTGSTISIILPKEIQEPGVFLQEQRIVGWTFGEGMERGYLWTGSAGQDLRPSRRLDEMKVLLSSNSREAQFIRILAIGKEVPAMEELEALAQAFRLTPLLDPEDVPAGLRPQVFTAQMDFLASELIRNGSSKEVIRILDDRVLTGAASPILVQDAVKAMVQYKDYNRAIQLLERINKDVLPKAGQTLSGLSQFHAQLYKDWLREIIQKGGYYSGVAAFEEARRAFPEDPEIHLLGVEVAISERAWERAKELLSARDYPGFLKTRASQLENLIQEQEASESTTIRFSPGERSIRVEALLNDRDTQKFILDTGAENTAIPTSALESLGIEINDRTQVKLIRSVTGLGITYEVTLESIELKGFRVENMDVLVIDLPGEPEYGILGLDFLNHFRFEIDNQRGLLHIRKRTSGERKP